MRAADIVSLTDGPRVERIRMTELHPDHAGPVLRLFPAKVPGGVNFVKKSGLVTDGTPDDFEALAGILPVFRIDPVT